MSIEDARELVESLVIAPECQIIKTIDLKGTLIMALDELEQYRAIGTVSEFRELMEKAMAKKAIPYENTGIIECPHCYTDISDSKTKWCCICGQHLDWSEGKE